MPHLRLRFIHSYVDRLGTDRHYFRRKGRASRRSRFLEFRDAYQAALHMPQGDGSVGAPFWQGLG